jgi:hypothetical protein
LAYQKVRYFGTVLRVTGVGFTNQAATIDMIFGLSLNDYAIQHDGRSPPLIVSRCIDAIERLGGVHREGIYRVSGRQSAIDKLRHCFERNEEALEFGKRDVPEDVFAIASILKIYLRELPDPVFKFSLSDRLSYSSKYCKLIINASQAPC